jgi:hypothetical protein
MKKLNLFLCLLLVCQFAFAQDEYEKEEKKGFKKENLFTGGSISLSFFNNSFLIGGNPVFGYSITKWADLGIVGNYTYTSQRDYQYTNDKLRQSVYGGGAFVRLFPVRFLFAQAQIEHNWIKLKYIPPPNTGMVSQSNKISGNSYLVGAGYTTGREADQKNTYGYFSVLFDLSKSINSPYTDNLGRAVPIIRAGIHIPLFQGKD